MRHHNHKPYMRFYFQLSGVTGQVTLRKTNLDLHRAKRLAVAMCYQVMQGKTKEDILNFRSQFLEKWADKPPGTLASLSHGHNLHLFRQTGVNTKTPGILCPEFGISNPEGCPRSKPRPRHTCDTRCCRSAIPDNHRSSEGQQVLAVSVSVCEE